MMRKLFLFTVVICSIFHGVMCRKEQDNQGRPPPPPPRPPPPPGTTEATPLPSPHNVPPPPLTPAPLLPNQCSFGDADLDSSEGYAEANTLYILANDPAECSGIVDSLELCFYITGDVKNAYSVQFLAFQRRYADGAVRSYHRLGTASANVGTYFVDGEGGEAACEILDLANVLRLNEGDVLGFVTEQGFSIAFSASDGRNVFRYVPSSQQQGQKQLSADDVSALQYLSATQLKQANNTATPVLKIIMNATDTSSQIIPTPTSMPTAEPDGCDGGRKRSRESTVSFFTFASAMVASAVMIAVLVVAVIVLLCCLCGCCVCCGGCCNCKICKVFSGKRCPCCCTRKGQSAQKVSGVHEQSMQYNELYMPTNQETVISRGKKQSTKLHENPAYGQPTASESSRGFDHTYESLGV